jgi:hypothetical protein
MKSRLATFIGLSLLAVAAGRAEPKTFGSGVGDVPEQEGGEPRVSLEGDWRPYQTTPLSVKRTINIERDGKSHQAEVTAPVLVRRGAVFLDPDKISEILKIRQEVDDLKADILRVKDKSKELAERYDRLIQNAVEQIPDRGEPDPRGLGGVAMRNIPNENQDR